MKSERRHELQHNALLDWLMETGKTIKPHTNAILLGIAVVMVGFAAYKWMSIQSSGNEAMAWNAVYLALNQNDTAALEQTLEDYPNTTAAQWAAVVAADLQLSAGCEDLFTTKATATDQFQKALEKYTVVLKRSRKPDIRERATFGLARTYEAMAGTRQSKEDLDRAREQYKNVVEGWPKGAYVGAAQSRLNALAQSSTLEFYDALAAWEPRPAITAPTGLDNLNIPFDESGKSLEVGETPKDFFGDVKDKIDEAMKAQSGIELPAESPEAIDAPAMPEATGEQPAEKPGATGDQPPQKPETKGDETVDEAGKPAE